MILLGLDRVRAVYAPILAVADVILPSGAEVRVLTGAASDEEAARSLATGGRIVALKQGADGSTVFAVGGD